MRHARRDSPMLRGLLVGLDGSSHGERAVALGIAWARRLNARLVGLGILDEPAIRGPIPVVRGVPHAESVAGRLEQARVDAASRQIGQFLDQFERRCAEAGVARECREVAGRPHEQILNEAQKYDLILLGQRTNFLFATRQHPDDTLPKVLKDSPRPVVVVPETWEAAGRAVVVAYDGSLQAARALAAFEATGLGASEAVHVVSVAASKDEAAALGERAVAFLRLHEINAELHPLAASDVARPAPRLLDQARRLDAGLLVMGAYGQPRLREFVLGSTTRTLLRESTVPLFLDH